MATLTASLWHRQQVPSYVTSVSKHLNGENLQHDWLGNGRAKQTGHTAVFPPCFVAIIYVLCLLSWGDGCQ